MQVRANLVSLTLLCLFSVGVCAESDTGTRVPMQRLELVDGSILSSAELAGRPAAYLFWATWCHVCQAEFPAYQRLHETHSGSGFRVIAVSLDDTAGVVRDFVRDHGYRLPVAMRTEAIRRAFGPIRGTPTLFVVDREGQVVLKRVGGIAYDKLDALVRSMR